MLLVWDCGYILLPNNRILPGIGVGPEEENGPCTGGVQPGQTHSDLLQFPEAASGGPHIPDDRAAEDS